MKIQKVADKQKDEWLAMRKDLYSDLDNTFHSEEMKWILESDFYQCFMVYGDANTIIGFLELSLRNIVDGCVGNPVGYIEGIYLKPEYRRKDYGKRPIGSKEKVAQRLELTQR